MSTTQTERRREFVSEMVTRPVARPEFQFTDEQKHARAKQEAAMRNAHRRALHEARMRVCPL